MIIHTSENAISRLPQIQPDTSLPLRDILHLILAGGPAQTVYNLSSGVHQRAVDFLCQDSGAIKEDSRYGPYFADTGDTRAFEFSGILAVAGIHFPGTVIRTDRGNEGTLVDVAGAAMASFVLNEAEHGWALMLFSVFPGILREWNNAKGDLVSLERILQKECTVPYGEGFCFGTHRIEGIAFAVSRCCVEKDIEPHELEGVWKDAYQYLLGAVNLMKRNQKEDGSLDRCWFRETAIPRRPAEWAQRLKDVAAHRFHPAEAVVYPTGHCLDAVSSIAEFVTADREWIEQACYILAQTIETQWTEVGRKVSQLSHAIHALKILDL